MCSSDLNYYANTQEENFYIIGNTEEIIVTINGKRVNPNVIPSNEGRVNNTGIILIGPKTIKENEIQIKVSKNSPTGQSEILAPGDIGTSSRRGNNKNNNEQNPSGGNVVCSKYTNNKQNNTRKLSTRKPRHNQR